MSLPARRRRSLARHRQEIGAVEAHRVGLDRRGQRQEAHHREHRDRLAGARIRRRSPAPRCGRPSHIDAVDRLERAAARGEGDGEVADFEQGHRQLRRITIHAEPRKSPSHPSSLEAYGFCLFKLGRTADAIPVFRQLIPLLPGSTYPSYDLAVVLVASHNDEEAVKVLEPLLTPDQTDPDILSLASQMSATGNTPKAVALQRQAIVLNPTDPSNYVLFLRTFA